MLIEDKYFVAYNAETKSIIAPLDYKERQSLVKVYPSKDIQVEVFDNEYDIVKFVNDNKLHYEAATED